MSIKPEEYALRRQQILASMRPHSIALIPAPAAPLLFRDADAEHFYRQNADFYYTTGFDYPEAVAVLIPDRPEGEYILFCQPKNESEEIWTGIRPGPQGACQDYGANEAFSIEELDNKLPELLAGCHHVYYPFGRDTDFDNTVQKTINTVRKKVRSGSIEPFELINIESILHEMRLRKSSTEIKLMRQATEGSVQGHIRAMKTCKPGLFEYQIAAEIQHECAQHGAKYQAYTPIIATGKNACILHYVENNDTLKDGDLLLIDAGGECEYYASDLTRTFPVNGKYSPEQRAVYNAVLKAQLAVIDSIAPGVLYGDLEKTVVRILTAELIELGLLQGDLDTLIENKAYSAFYMHRIGHWIGLDVHDAGKYKVNNQWRPLEPGMVLTVEPGLYISANNPNVDKKWWNIGVRIEDDVLVTENGCDVLSKDLPKTVEDIEALMANK